MCLEERSCAVYLIEISEKTLARPLITRVPFVANYHPLGIGIAVLAVVKVLTHHQVEAGAAEIQDLLKWLAEVAIECGINNWI